jgi:hypothetical protein
LDIKKDTSHKVLFLVTLNIKRYTCGSDKSEEDVGQIKREKVLFLDIKRYKRYICDII